MKNGLWFTSNPRNVCINFGLPLTNHFPVKTMA